MRSSPPSTPPVTLVGHSAAGYPITLAAERAPREGRPAGLPLRLCPPPPAFPWPTCAAPGLASRLPGLSRVDPDRVTYRVATDKARACFYQDCHEEAVAYALPRLCPEPIRPQATPLPPLTRWPGIERHYIRCDDDRTIPPEYQTAMSAEFPPGTVTALPTGHSPFFAAPDLLARRLHRISGGKSGLSEAGLPG